MAIKDVIISIAIIILTISVVVFGINTFYKSPGYEDFCKDINYNVNVSTVSQCEDNGGKWFADRVVPKIPSESIPNGYCDLTYECNNDYESSREIYSRNIFLIALPLGIIIIALGAVVFGLEAVGAGLMGGGVGVILYGVVGFWQFAQDWLKFGLSLLGLIVVIWLAYWINKRVKRK